MSDPIKRITLAQADDPFDIEPEQPKKAEPKPAEPAPAAKVETAKPAPKAEEAEVVKKPENSTVFSGYHPGKRLDFILGGQHTFATKFAPTDEPFKSAAPTYNGLGLFLQASYDIVPSSDIAEFRLGVDYKSHFLSLPREQGSVASSVDAHSLGALLEFNGTILDTVTLGLNGTLGYLWLFSSNADVGAPVSAKFDQGEGAASNLYVGAQAYVQISDQLNFANGIFRLGVSFETMPSGFALPTAEGKSDLQIDVQPMVSLFLAANISQIILNATTGNFDLRTQRNGTTNVDE